MDPTKPVLVPGDPERLHMQSTDLQGGIAYHANQIDSLNVLALKLGIQPLQFNEQK